MKKILLTLFLLIFLNSKSYSASYNYNCKIISAEKIEKSGLDAKEYTLTPLPLKNFEDRKLEIREPVIGTRSIKVENEQNFFIGRTVKWRDSVEIIGSNKVGGIYDYFSVFNRNSKILRLETIENYNYEKIIETNRKYQCY